MQNETLSETCEGIMEELSRNTNIINGEEYAEKLSAISQIASSMVEKTLGPYGATTLVDDGNHVYPTKDGWNILKNLRFNDAVANSIYNPLKQVSFSLVNKVGDGTTTSFVGANIFIRLLMQRKKWTRQKEFLDILRIASKDIANSLEDSKYVHKINPHGDFSDIYEVARIASNGNTELAEMIQKIYQTTQNPNIYVTYDQSNKLKYSIQQGYKLDCNPINQKAYRNSDDGTYVLREPSLIAIFDHNVEYNMHEKMIAAMSRYASAQGKTIFIFAPHFDDVITSVIGANINRLLNQGQIPNVMLIQVPLSMEMHRAYLSDLVLLTNSQTIDPGKVQAFNTMIHNQTAKKEDIIADPLLDTEQYHFDSPTDILELVLGKSIEIIIGEKYVLIDRFDEIVNSQVYKNTLKDLEEKYKELKKRAENSSSMLQKDYMDAYQHYTKFFGEMGTILVGGGSDLEKSCLKDAVDDAVLACRSAYDHGYIRGLNLATINTIDALIHDFDENGYVSYHHDEPLSDPLYREALQLLRDTFFEISMTVLRNRQPDDASIQVFESVNILSKQEPAVHKTEKTNSELLQIALENEWGYDMENSCYYEDDECPVINSTRTDIEVLNGLVSIVSMMLTSNQLISFNQVFNRTMTAKQKRAEEVNAKKDIATAVTNAILDVMTEDSSYLAHKKDTFLKRFLKAIKKEDES